MTTNRETARYLRRLGALLELNGASRSRNRILREAAATIEASATLIGSGDLDEEGLKLGEEPRAVLTEYFDQGGTSLFDEHKDSYPLGLIDVVQVPGIGAARARSLHEALGVAGLDSLIAVAEAGDLPKIKGIGARSAVKILKAAQVFKEEVEALEREIAEETVEVESAPVTVEERGDRIREVLREAIEGEAEGPASAPREAPDLRVVEIEEEPQDATDHLWSNLRCSACHTVGLEGTFTSLNDSQRRHCGKNRCSSRRTSGSSTAYLGLVRQMPGNPQPCAKPRQKSAHPGS